MPRAPTSDEYVAHLTRSPLWDAALTRVEDAISRSDPGDAKPTDAAVEAAREALAHAHERLLLALDGWIKGADAVDELLSSASQLASRVCDVWDACDGPKDDRRGMIAEALARRLSAHEQDVLAGELTYAATRQEAGQPADRAREVLAGLALGGAGSHGELLALRTAVTQFAALLVRAAGNLLAADQPGEAPEAPTPDVERALGLVVRELNHRAAQLSREPTDADVVSHHLAAALRLPVSGAVLGALSSASGASTVQADVLDAARGAWLQLATYERIAVSALDGELDEPTYQQRFGTLDAAITEGATNVLSGARLIGRPIAFRHRKAWGSQAVALSYALEAYIRGLRGIADGFAQAQLITLTRLVRATAATVVVELLRARSSPGNGRLTR